MSNKPQSSSATTLLPNGSVDVRMIAAIRFILACSALVIAYVDPTQPAIFSALTYSSLVIYTIWSFILAIIAFRRDPSAPPPRDTYWGDVLFCAYLVTLTHGTNSLFFTYFLFAILSASFSRGTQEGLLVTGTAVILFILASIWFEPDAKFGFDQTLVRPLYLITLGYMISYWGGHEISQRRRMWLLQEINNQQDQRQGYEHALTANLEKIRLFFQAKACILVLYRPNHQPKYFSFYVPQSQLHKANIADMDSTETTHPNSLSDEAAMILLGLPNKMTAFHRQNISWWQQLFTYTGDHKAFASELNVLANLLDTNSFLTVPYSQQDGTFGRFFLIPQKQSLSQYDVTFVQQLLNAISHVMESILLIDELAASSAKHERFKISLDIHDTTIQPYIGLKLGLEALNRQAGDNNPLGREISELLHMTEATIQDLRRYVTTLREDKNLAGDALIKSAHAQAERFKRYYDIDVTVKCDERIQVNSKLSAAAIQIVAEGLSNILKHTKAKHAYVSIHGEPHSLQIEIGNDAGATGKQETSFIPASIHTRAVSMGGTSQVIRDAQNYTVVSVNLPI